MSFHFLLFYSDLSLTHSVYIIKNGQNRQEINKQFVSTYSTIYWKYLTIWGGRNCNCRGQGVAWGGIIIHKIKFLPTNFKKETYIVNELKATTCQIFKLKLRAFEEPTKFLLSYTLETPLHATLHIEFLIWQISVLLT